MAVLVSRPPCVVHEDEHLLVVNKPAGMNTHSPSLYAGEGIYDWLRNREPRWSSLAIVHRLDKVTSGLILFAKTRQARQSLTQQFTNRNVRKHYLFLSDMEPKERKFTVRSGVARAGDRYVASPYGEPAETRFIYLRAAKNAHLFTAEPVTGRTHQIRVHAELKEVPILGDNIYGGRVFPRVCLHAHEISFKHPSTGEQISFQNEPDFSETAHTALRDAFIEPDLTNAFRLIHGASDGQPELYVERWNDNLLVQSLSEFSGSMKSSLPSASVYFKRLSKECGRTSLEEAQPQLVSGTPAPNRFTIRENGVAYEISFQQGYSVGLFLDQRDNRRRFLENYIGPEFPVFEKGLAGREILNTFAYTCGFSVCAALAGARTTSLDLSRKYLEWGKRNFALNQLDSSAHEFIYGDLFDWTARLARKSRRFDVVILDPPTFSRSKSGSVFQAEKHYGKLVAAILQLLRANGVLFASTNAHKLPAERFLEEVRSVIHASHRRTLQMQYIPQPPDFPISRDEPAYLKTVWLRIS